MRTKKEILLEVASKGKQDFDGKKIDDVDYNEVLEIIYEAMEKYKDEWWEEQTKKLKS